MFHIRPIADLRNKFPEIENVVRERMKRNFSPKSAVS